MFNLTSNQIKHMTTKQLVQVAQWADEGHCEYLSFAGNWTRFPSSVKFYIALDEDFSNYRRKPSPQYRPWTPEEVPVGALIRYESNPTARIMILGVDNSGCIVDGTPLKYGEEHYIYTVLSAFNKCEHSLDHGKTWLPCGVAI